MKKNKRFKEKQLLAKAKARGQVRESASLPSAVQGPITPEPAALVPVKVSADDDLNWQHDETVHMWILTFIGLLWIILPAIAVLAGAGTLQQRLALLLGLAIGLIGQFYPKKVSHKQK